MLCPLLFGHRKSILLRWCHSSMFAINKLGIETGSATIKELMRSSHAPFELSHRAVQFTMGSDLRLFPSPIRLNTHATKTSNPITPIMISTPISGLPAGS